MNQVFGMVETLKSTRQEWGKEGQTEEQCTKNWTLHKLDKWKEDKARIVSHRLPCQLSPKYEMRREEWKKMNEVEQMCRYLLTVWKRSKGEVPAHNLFFVPFHLSQSLHFVPLVWLLGLLDLCVTLDHSTIAAAPIWWHQLLFLLPFAILPSTFKVIFLFFSFFAFFMPSCNCPPTSDCRLYLLDKWLPVAWAAGRCQSFCHLSMRAWKNHFFGQQYQIA